MTIHLNSFKVKYFGEVLQVLGYREVELEDVVQEQFLVYRSPHFQWIDTYNFELEEQNE